MFSNRLVLMITDSKGSRIFNINSIFKRAIFYIAVFIFTLIFFSLISISIFRQELAEIKQNNQALSNEYQKLLEKNTLLNDKIEQRIEELTLVGDSVEHLEGMVGIPLDKEEYEKISYGLQDRLEIASLAGAQKAFVMKFIPNGYPTDYYRRISDFFGYRYHPILKRKHLHSGVDFSATIGTPIYATADGVVEFARKHYNGGYGNLIKIDHSFGFKTYYAHLDDLLVKRGDFVRKGQIIAYSGNSGMSTGPHLHYEIRFLGVCLDPQIFIEWNMRDFDSIFKKEINIPWQSLLTTINKLMEQMEPPSSQVEQK